MAVKQGSQNGGLWERSDLWLSGNEVAFLQNPTQAWQIPGLWDDSLPAGTAAPCGQSLQPAWAHTWQKPNPGSAVTLIST